MRFLKPEEYGPIVEAIYVDLSIKLSKAVPSALVDHIGSSAISGAISKGDLDVLVRISKFEFNEALEGIKELGFIEKSGHVKN